MSDYGFSCWCAGIVPATQAAIMSDSCPTDSLELETPTKKLRRSGTVVVPPPSTEWTMPTVEFKLHVGKHNVPCNELDGKTSMTINVTTSAWLLAAVGLGVGRAVTKANFEVVENTQAMRAIRSALHFRKQCPVRNAWKLDGDGNPLMDTTQVEVKLRGNTHTFVTPTGRQGVKGAWIEATKENVTWLIDAIHADLTAPECDTAQIAEPTTTKLSDERIASLKASGIHYDHHSQRERFVIYSQAGKITFLVRKTAAVHDDEVELQIQRASRCIATGVKPAKLTKHSSPMGLGSDCHDNRERSDESESECE